MRRAALLAALLLAAGTATAQLFDDDAVLSAPNLQRLWGGDPLAGLPVLPEFLVAPAEDFRTTAVGGSRVDAGAGLGAECACADISTATGEAITFTRASTAWCTKADYSLVSCATNKPRVMSGTGGTSPLGIFIEPVGTNSLVYSRDLSQAAWTKSASMSCALTSTGVDGAANSASTCTASGASQTVLQALALAAASRNSSMYIRRRTGTGTVEVTRDNGSTWHDITSSLSATYQRVVSVEAVGCAYGNCIIVPGMAGSVLNPTVGVRLTTSGDAVDVDLVQDETGAYPTSPVTTAAVAATHAVEAASASKSINAKSVSYSVVMTGFTGIYESAMDTRSDGAHFFSSYITADADSSNGGSAWCFPYTGAGGAGSTTVYVPPLGPTPIQCELVSGVSIRTSTLGVQTTQATVATTTPTSSISIGSGIAALGGVVSGLCASADAGGCFSGSSHSTAIAWVGDSITRGDAATPSRPPAALRSLRPGRTVYNLGINAQPASGCATVATGAINSRADTLVLLCGVNSLQDGAASVWAQLQSTLNAAKAAGMTVVPVLLTPWASAATWTAPKQGAQDSVNASLTAWCTANGATCVDTSSLGTGSPASLKPAYDSGDGLHLNAAGGAELAALVEAALP